MSMMPFSKGFQVSLSDVQDEFSRMLDRMWHTGFSTAPLDGQNWAPAIDLVDEPTQYVLTAEIPGLDVEDIELCVEGGELVLKGHKANGHNEEDEEGVSYIRRERRCGSFCRRVQLPEQIKEEAISARCRKGLLEVVLPKVELPTKKTVKIEVAE